MSTKFLNINSTTGTSHELLWWYLSTMWIQWYIDSNIISLHNVDDFVIQPTVEEIINRGRTFCVASNMKCIWVDPLKQLSCMSSNWFPTKVYCFHECLFTQFWLFALNISVRTTQRTRKPLPRRQEQCLAPRNLYAAAQYVRNLRFPRVIMIIPTVPSKSPMHLLRLWKTYDQTWYANVTVGMSG